MIRSTVEIRDCSFERIALGIRCKSVSQLGESTIGSSEQIEVSDYVLISRGNTREEKNEALVSVREDSVTGVVDEGTKPDLREL